MEQDLAFVLLFFCLLSLFSLSITKTHHHHTPGTVPRTGLSFSGS
jgi:hypothetical protein